MNAYAGHLSCGSRSPLKSHVVYYNSGCNPMDVVMFRHLAPRCHTGSLHSVVSAITVQEKDCKTRTD